MSENQTLEVEPLIAKITYFATEQTAICAILLNEGIEIIGLFACVNEFDIEKAKIKAYNDAVHKIKAKLAWPRYSQLLNLIASSKDKAQKKILVREYLYLGQLYNFPATLTTKTMR